MGVPFRHLDGGVAEPGAHLVEGHPVLHEPRRKGVATLGSRFSTNGRSPGPGIEQASVSPAQETTGDGLRRQIVALQRRTHSLKAAVSRSIISPSVFAESAKRGRGDGKRRPSARITPESTPQRRRNFGVSSFRPGDRSFRPGEATPTAASGGGASTARNDSSKKRLILHYGSCEATTSTSASIPTASVRKIRSHRIGEALLDRLGTESSLE